MFCIEDVYQAEGHGSIYKGWLEIITRLKLSQGSLSLRFKSIFYLLVPPPTFAIKCEMWYHTNLQDLFLISYGGTVFGMCQNLDWNYYISFKIRLLLLGTLSSKFALFFETLQCSSLLILFHVCGNDFDLDVDEVNFYFFTLPSFCSNLKGSF